MTIKRFEAATLAEALSLVKQELGGEAVILHTRSIKRGGVMGLGCRENVEITAGLDVNIGQRKRAGSPARPAAAEKPPEAARQAAAFEAQHVVRKTYAAAGSGPRPASAATAATAAPAAATAAAPLADAAAHATTRQLAAAMLQHPAFELRGELAALRTMVESLLQRTRAGTGTSTTEALPEQLAKAYTALLEQQVADEIALRLVDDVRMDLPREQWSNQAAVREQLLLRLERLVPCAGAAGVARPATGAGCRSICLIGPTGVGKTTTLAKLAAAMKLRQRQNVGLITIDTYRIAAVDQLRTYANIIGVPLKVVLTPAELVAAMREFASCDSILIDTMGRSQHDQLKLNELSAFIQAAKPSEVHLVLSSTCTQRAMESALEKFSAVRVDHIIFTKLDEAVSFGVLLNVASRASKALSYITTGQDVPDHIEVGQPRRLARLILGESV